MNRPVQTGATSPLWAVCARASRAHAIRLICAGLHRSAPDGSGSGP